MKRTPRAWLWVVIVGGVILGRSSAGWAAADLTGEWTGKYSCKGLSGGELYKLQVRAATLSVVQTGSSLLARIDDSTGSYQYGGVAVDAVGKPGRGAVSLIACPTDAQSNTYNQMLSAPFVVRPTSQSAANAKLRGIAPWEAGPVVGALCRYSFTRTSTITPVVAACPP